MKLSVLGACAGLHLTPRPSSDIRSLIHRLQMLEMHRRRLRVSLLAAITIAIGLELRTAVAGEPWFPRMFVRKLGAIAIQTTPAHRPPGFLAITVQR